MNRECCENFVPCAITCTDCLKQEVATYKSQRDLAMSIATDLACGYNKLEAYEKLIALKKEVKSRSIIEDGCQR